MFPRERLPQVDNAYDVLLMQSLTKRRSGVVTDSRVKYADVPRPTKVLGVFRLDRAVLTSSLPRMFRNATPIGIPRCGGSSGTCIHATSAPLSALHA